MLCNKKLMNEKEEKLFSKDFTNTKITSVKNYKKKKRVENLRRNRSKLKHPKRV